MRADEWQRAIENEAASVGDQGWAREARRAAWWSRRKAELRNVMSWRPLSRLVLVVSLPYLVFLGPMLNGLNGLSGPLDHLIINVLLGFNTPGLGFLLLLIWAGRYAGMGYALWGLAGIGTVLGLFPGLFFLWQAQLQGAKLSLTPGLLVGSVLFSFTLLLAFARAIQTLYRRRTGQP